MIGSTILNCFGVGFVVDLESKTKSFESPPTQTANILLNSKMANKVISSSLVYYS